MLSSRGVRLSYRALHNGKGRPVAVLGSIRHLSSRPRTIDARSLRSTSNALGPGPIWRLPTILAQLPRRYASTTPPPATIPPNAQPLNEAPLSADDWSTSLDNLAASNFPPLIEHIGYLKQLGLDYGWGPTALIETLLEYVHIYSGTPWWGTILLTALFVRVVLFRFNVIASDQSVKLAVLEPSIGPIRQRMNEAKKAQNQPEMMLALGELRKVYGAAGFSFLKMTGPFLQIPLGFGTFRLMRGMADLPVPGLDTGGFLWLQDLTISDPYFILPIMTAAAFHISVKAGGELGMSAKSTSQALRATMLYGIPTFTLAIMLFMPACLQLTFGFTSIFGLAQGRLLRWGPFRQWLGITPIPPKPKPSPNPGTPYEGTLSKYDALSTAAALEKKSILGGAISDIKGAASGAVKSAKETMESRKPTTRLTPAELRRAKAYEERRKREIEQEKYEADQRRMERKRR